MAWLKKLLCAHDYRFRGYMDHGRIAVFRCPKCKKIDRDIRI